METIQTFHLEHNQRYGHSDSRKPVELVNIRLKAIGRTSKPLLDQQKGTSAINPKAIIGQRQVIFGGTKLDTKIYDRSNLRPGNRLEGPSIILQMDTTTVISPKWRGEIDSWGNLILQRSY
jgi:N-methylhydantoinase A